MRAHLYRPIQDNQGDIRTGAVVTVYAPGSAVPTPVTLYPSDTGTVPLANPFTANAGVVDFYTERPGRFRLGIKAGNENEYFIEGMDSLVPPPEGAIQEFILPGPVVLAKAINAYTYTPVPFARRALLTRFEVHSSATNKWSVRVTSQPNGAGEVMLEAVGIGAAIYSCSWPWTYRNDVDQSVMYVGVIDDTNNAANDFTLTALRGEVFKP